MCDYLEMATAATLIGIALAAFTVLGLMAMAGGDDTPEELEEQR